MIITPTVQSFPATGHTKDTSGLPWGATVQPLLSSVPISLPTEGSPLASDIARCKNCLAYINPFCSLSNVWTCAICQQRNAFHPSDHERYLNVEDRSLLPELGSQAIEYRVDPSTDRDANTPIELSDVPIFIALVDVSTLAEGGAEYLQSVRNAITAALEAMPPSALFGIVTFSHRVGIYNLATSRPHIYHVPVGTEQSPSKGACRIAIDELLAVDQFLVQVSEKREAIAFAIDSLELATPGDGRRCFGAAVQLLIDFFSGFSSLNVRILSLLSGAPNHGIGAVPSESLGRSSVATPKHSGTAKASRDPEEVDLSPATPFYREEASSAGQHGLVFDLLLLAPSSHTHFALPSIKFLSLFTGGRVGIYSCDDTSTLPQDLFRWLSGPYAFRGLLRIRTAPEMGIRHSYGPLVTDQLYDNLFHIPGCDSWQTVAFDFQFTGPNGFTGPDGTQAPAMQMAFAYNYLPPADAPDRTMERRLRIYTTRVRVGSTPAHLHASADSAAIFSLLTHKLLRAALDDGIREARLNLQDWLTILYSRYKEHSAVKPAGGQAAARSPPPAPQSVNDLEFAQHPNLAILPKLAFALMKNDLLHMSTDPDKWSLLQCFYSALPSNLLQKLLYPMLDIYGLSNNLLAPKCHLTRATTTDPAHYVLLLDGVTRLAFYYTAQVPESTPLPPPKDHPLRVYLDQIRATYPIVVQPIYTRAGSPSEASFTSLLIDEQTPSGPSYQRFLEMCAQELANLEKQ